MLPERLLRFKNVLLQIQPENQSIPYNDAWESYFRHDPDFVEITQRFPNAITRGNITILSAEAANDHGNVRKLFLASMIWGYGRKGYGPYRTNCMLSDEQANSMLQRSLSMITDGQVIEAYEKFQLPCCGPVFMTKFFYFIGLGVEANPCPLVFDARVARAFRVLIHDEALNFADFARIRENKEGKIVVLPYPKGYMRYIEKMGQWALELGCRPDSIELFLFDPPLSFGTA